MKDWQKMTIWIIGILAVCLVFYGAYLTIGLSQINNNPVVFRFEIDDNARAVFEKAYSKECDSYSVEDFTNSEPTANLTEDGLIYSARVKPIKRVS